MDLFKGLSLSVDDDGDLQLRPKRRAKPKEPSPFAKAIAPFAVIIIGIIIIFMASLIDSGIVGGIAKVICTIFGIIFICLGASLLWKRVKNKE